ncbi:uncharacterized protein LOC101864157 [Aplysia californica]|uniref:Uncharacterized protein LOC101864157 n=1 Tax=Aplysia californica TaxID=6500 RepID=A0ABM0JTY2_APLCA|nr:uncharacterized protein LOC101864157 [Aplysia californica]
MAVSSGYLIEWTGGKNLGFLSSMALASTKGSIFMNLLITWYLNPGNLAPDLDQDRTKYFQQEQILDRVPSVFLVLAATFTTIHLCGFFMLSDLKSGRDVANDVEQNQIESLDPDVEPKLSLLDKRHFKKDNGIVYQPIRQHDLHDDDSLLDKDGDGYKDAETRSRSEVNLHLGTPPFQGSDIVYGKGQEAEEELLLKEFDEQEVENGQNEQQQKSTSSANAPTWRDAVRTKHFYVLWFASGSAIMANVIVSTFFKSFGQSLIKDDHFLSSIGTFMAAGLFVSRMIWGFVIDNTDLKSSLVSYYSILSLSGTFWIFTPHIGKWVFLMWTTLLASFAGGFHTVIYVSVYASFGGTNFTTIYGLVCCSGIIVTLFLPVVLSAILEHFSWSGLFFTMASGNIISLVLIVVYFPRKF